MSVTILFLWTVVAVGNAGSGSKAHMDWRAVAEFRSPEACVAAIKQLGLNPEKARCAAK